jgi:hypothetical protein
MPRTRINLTGKQFGRWTVKRLATAGKHINYRCVCRCGTKKRVCSSSLTSGRSTSCGCFHKQKIHRNVFGVRHGHAHTGKISRTYHSWVSMKHCCNNPRSKDYKYYGAQGVEVCRQWNGRKSFPQFLADMGVRPDGKILTRMDRSDDFKPGNCKWATRKTKHENN